MTSERVCFEALEDRVLMSADVPLDFAGNLGGGRSPVAIVVNDTAASLVVRDRAVKTFAPTDPCVTGLVKATVPPNPI